MSDDDNHGIEDSAAFNAAKLLSRFAAGEEAEAVVDGMTKRLVPEEMDGRTFDTVVAEGVTRGLSISRGARARAEEQARKEMERPTVQTREIQHPDGEVLGIRLWVAADDPRFDLVEGGVNVHVSGSTVEVSTGFVPHDIEVDRSGDGFTEAVVEAAPALPDE